MGFPTDIKTFTTKTDNVDEIMAVDVNEVQTEITAIETELGTNPKETAASVKARIAAIEAQFAIAATKVLTLLKNLTSQGGDGTLVWPAAGATLTISGTGTASLTGHLHSAADLTSGTLSTDRFSAYSDLTAENKIGAGNAQIAPGIAMQYRNMFGTPTDHFETGANENEPSATGWGSWATNAGFSVPDGLNQVVNKSLYYLSFLSGTDKKGFLPRSASITSLTGLSGEVKAVLRNMPTGGYIGVRIDNNAAGASENAVEILIRQAAAGIEIVGRQTSSGTVTVTTIRTIPLSLFLSVYIAAGGTYYSNWYVNSYMKVDSPAVESLGFAPGGLSWQPQRLGLVFYVPGTAGWYYGAFADMWTSGI